MKMAFLHHLFRPPASESRNQAHHYKAFAQEHTYVVVHLQADLFTCSGVAHFSLTYGLRNTGMSYDRAMFGMKLPDCRSLAKTLESSEALVSLALPGNLLEDDKIRMIASGLVDNHSVTNLDLSHNKVRYTEHDACDSGADYTLALL